MSSKVSHRGNCIVDSHPFSHLEVRNQQDVSSKPSALLVVALSSIYSVFPQGPPHLVLHIHHPSLSTPDEVCTKQSVD